MKKFTLFTFVLIAAFCFSGNTFGQNLMLNGDLEQWDDAQNPTDWDKAENIEQEMTNINSGTYSAKHISASGTKDFQQVVEGITGGTNYTISYYYLDNDPMARTRIWAYWLQGDQTIDDHADVLRPGTYSEDNADWILWEQTLTAPANADGFRFEVRVYKQDEQTGGAVFYDDFAVEAASVSPEPTNYPTDFAATANGLNVDLSWSDALGGDLPSGYLILAADEGTTWTLPEDGNPVSDDLDLSDGNGAVNIAYGEEVAAFSGLQGATAYNFVIFPYSNGGMNIDYKTDGTAPQAQAETASAVIITSVDFNDNTWGTWTTLSIVGQELWELIPNYGVDDSPCAKMSGYSSSAMDNEDWLLSPILNMDDYQNEIFNFFTAQNYSGPQLEVLYSTNYPGGGEDPNGSDWTTLDAELSNGSWEWTASGDIDLSGVIGENVTLAFKYTSTNSAAAAWEVDNVMLLGEYEVGIQHNEPLQLSIYPNPAKDLIRLKTNESGIIRIVSLTGEIVLEKSVNATENINVDALASGLYIVKFIADRNNLSTISKLIIQ